MGTSVPLALRMLRLPVKVEYHEQHFTIDAQDDTWLPVVGEWGWIVIGHDSRYHLKPNELFALRQYNVGCFYLWGAEVPRWEKMRLFARAYDKIIIAAQTTPRPFVYRITRDARLLSVSF